MLGFSIVAAVVLVVALVVTGWRWARRRAVPVLDVFDAEAVAVLLQRGARSPQLGEGERVLSAQVVVRRSEGDELVGVWERPEDLPVEVKSQLIVGPFITDVDRPNLQLPADELTAAQRQLEVGEVFRFSLPQPVAMHCTINREGALGLSLR